jgi:hypothetical protein
LLAEGVYELRHPPQTLEIEKMARAAGRNRGAGTAAIIGRVEGDARMTAVGQTHDNVGPLAVADADDGQSLSAQRMVGMRYRHPCRSG